MPVHDDDPPPKRSPAKPTAESLRATMTPAATDSQRVVGSTTTISDPQQSDQLVEFSESDAGIPFSFIEKLKVRALETPYRALGQAGPRGLHEALSVADPAIDAAVRRNH